MSETLAPPRPDKKPHESTQSDAYILGGGDLEMKHAERRIREASARIVGEVTTWEGADIANRQAEIEEAKAQGLTPVLIEHRGADDVDGIVHIDHHNQNSGRDAAITQVLERLGVEPNFADKLIAANDSRYIQGMETLLDGDYRDRLIATQLKKGATEQEAEAFYQTVRAKIISGIRKKDREAQGVTEDDERDAEKAIANMEDRDGLKVVKLKGHRDSPVHDRLFLAGAWENGEENMAIVCRSEAKEKEVWFFGKGDIVQATQAHFAELKRKRIEADPNEPPRKGIYHTVTGGAGGTDPTKEGRVLVVASDPEEVIEYIHKLELAKNRGK